MRYGELFREENEHVAERYRLTIDRLGRIPGENTVDPRFRSYFEKVASFLLFIDRVYGLCESGNVRKMSAGELAELNHSLYEDVLPAHYGESFANPAYAAQRMGAELGPLLSFLYTEIRGGIVYAFESRLTDITILNELFIEVYNLFEEGAGTEDGAPAVKEVQSALYWFVSDYCDVTVPYRIRESVDPALDFAADIIMNSDLSDTWYLYFFGEYVGERELKVAEYLNSLDEETIGKMAHTFTEGYRKGFEVTGRNLAKKKTVTIRYELGFERMIRQAVLDFEAMGLVPIFCRAAVNCVNRTPGRRTGYHGSTPNPQYDYDHRYDQAIYLDKAFRDRKLAVLKVAYEQWKKEAAVYAGPAVVETFGEAGFEPQNKPEAFRLTEKQEKLSIAYANEAMEIQNRYIPGEEVSFTIIAFPVPEIGGNFPEIFAETIRINTLDYEIYKDIQQKLIDVLDKARCVRIKGSSGNRTDLTVCLKPLADPARQTNFENCVADVNIPLGEVFTSPQLKGTNGVLHVSNVYIGSIQFKDLVLTFEDGMVKDYSCKNFEDPEEGRTLISQVILKNHPTLPMGEFAVGTNTTAYAMAQKYGIIDRLPILIVEKMGPHFAVGDTCYSWAEDTAVYNPDGKEIVARDNEISVLRREDVSKAYFGCHTDITIPYSELGGIWAVLEDGSEIPVIGDGKFLVPGTEELNKPLT